MTAPSLYSPVVPLESVLGRGQKHRATGSLPSTRTGTDTTMALVLAATVVVLEVVMARANMLLTPPV